MRAPGRRERQRRAWRHVGAAHGVPHELHGLGVFVAALRRRAPCGFEDTIHDPPEGARHQDEQKPEQEEADQYVTASVTRRGAGAGVSRRRDAFERAARRLRFRAARRERNHLLPCRLRTREILLAERQHDPLIQQRLGVPGIELQRLLEDRKSTRLNSSHLKLSRMPSSA